MGKRCCEYHDRLPEEFAPGMLPDAFADGCECGLAGTGRPSVCCCNCPQTKWFVEHRGIPVEHIDFAKELCAPNTSNTGSPSKGLLNFVDELKLAVNTILYETTSSDDVVAEISPKLIKLFTSYTHDRETEARIDELKYFRENWHTLIRQEVHQDLNDRIAALTATKEEEK